MRLAYSGALFALFSIAISDAAEFRPSAREVWSGTYTCGAIERDPDQWPGYSSRAQLILENGVARVTRESTKVREMLTGEVAPDGGVRLEGTGSSREGETRWRFRFDGEFQGDRFSAKGAMLSASLATKLRDCSMSLTRVQASGGPAPREPAAATAAPPPEQPAPAAAAPSPPRPEVAAAAVPPSPPPQEAAAPAASAAEKPAAPTPSQASVKIVEGKELNVTTGNDTAVVHAKVSSAAPHRYPVAAKKGQTLSATLLSNGAQLDIYEPGASIDIQGTGFTVQGTKVKAVTEGQNVSAELPEDGKYLLLVRSLRDDTPYTLELAATPPPLSSQDASFFGVALTDKAAWVALLLLLAAAGGGMVVYSKRDRRLFKTR
jgi:hypothetical protein